MQRTKHAGFSNKETKAQYKKRAKCLNRHLTKEWQMVNKCLERCCTSYVFRDRELKQRCTTAYLLGWESRNRVKPWQSQCWGGCGAAGAVTPHWWACTMAQPVWKTVWQFLKSLTWLYHTTEQWHSYYVHPKACTQMFVAALFITSKLGSNHYVLQWVNGYINHGASRRWNCIQQ